jgi:hypothetical protein
MTGLIIKNDIEKKKMEGLLLNILFTVIHSIFDVELE